MRIHEAHGEKGDKDAPCPILPGCHVKHSDEDERMISKPRMVKSGPGRSLWRGWESGLDRVWQSLFGSPDLGAVDFRTLKRRTTPNDALACPQGFCPEAQADFEPPVFSLPAERLRALVPDMARSEPNTMLVHSGPDQDRYLVRTRMMRFPDTVVVHVMELEENRSTLALYSRSQIGRSDFGVNKRRLERWIKRISTRVAQEQDVSGH